MDDFLLYGCNEKELKEKNEKIKVFAQEKKNLKLKLNILAMRLSWGAAS